MIKKYPNEIISLTMEKEGEETTIGLFVWIKQGKKRGRSDRKKAVPAMIVPMRAL